MELEACYKLIAVVAVRSLAERKEVGLSREGKSCHGSTTFLFLKPSTIHKGCIESWQEYQHSFSPGL